MPSKIHDKHGNEIWCENKRVFLRLLNSSKVRCLGIVEGNKFLTQRKLGKHVMRNVQDIGFNYSLIKRGRFEFVEVSLSDGRVLKASRMNILEQGACRQFKGEGFELQIFLPLDKFDIPQQESLEFSGVT